jgi:hypothetical protein
MPEPIEIPAHESLVESVMHKATGSKKPYKPLKTLEEARAAEHGAVVIEGDWGGTVYLSCPVKYVHATQEEIEALAEWLERQFWGCNFLSDGEGGHGVYYKDAPPGTGIWGGMGGGRHLDGLWAHPDIAEVLGAEIITRLKLKKTHEDPMAS